jgi:hypothetical protein
VSARIRAGSRFKRFLCFILIDVRCFRVLSGVRVPQLKTSGLHRLRKGGRGYDLRPVRRMRLLKYGLGQAVPILTAIRCNPKIFEILTQTEVFRALVCSFATVVYFPVIEYNKVD